MSEPERGDRAPAPCPGEAERAPVAGATPVGPPASEARPAAGSEPAAPAPGPPAAPAAGEAAPAKVATPVSPAKPAAAAPPAIQRGARPGALAERPERLALDRLLEQFALHEQVTRLVCVEGWSTIAWWGGIRFADFLGAFPPAPGARWAALRSSVGLDTAGRPESYYVSIDLETARHPQTLLATHQDGRPLTLAHGAPLRLLVPMKLGLKNIKAVTDIAYSASEPPDYWNEQGYSKY